MIEFWQSRYFWKPAVVIIVIGCIVAGIVLFVEAHVKVDQRKTDFKFKEFVFRAAKGEVIDDRTAWPDYLSAVKYGRYLYEQKKKGVELDAILKQVAKLRVDIKSKENDSRPKYEHFLAESHNTPWILIEMTKGENWMKIENNPEDIKALKAILSHGELNLGKLDLDLKVNIVLAVLLIAATQFIAYLAGTIRYDHNINEEIRKSKLTFGAFITFLIFSPGALLFIVIQLVMIGRHQIPEYISARRERANMMPNLKAIEMDSSAQEAQLAKLRERLKN